jgi:hypothetical protein
LNSGEQQDKFSHIPTPERSKRSRAHYEEEGMKMVAITNGGSEEIILMVVSE